MTHVPWHPDNMDDMEQIHGIESVELTSVGIDVGTTTSHLTFSQLVARRSSGEFSSKFQIVDRETVYRSPISLTPFKNGTIDPNALDEFLQDVYEDAGFDVEDIDTGAVIVTGEASRKENAEAIADLFSEQAGKFVCATAGANLEALMSAHGSGAVDYSIDSGQDVLHVDIGGGTTKLAYIVDGFVKDTASINIGARLVTFDDDGRIERVENAAKTIGNEIGIDLTVGREMSDEDRERLADRFAALLVKVIDGDESEQINRLMVTDPLKFDNVDSVTFAGGVAEYVYGRESGYYNDLGPELGHSIQTEIADREYSVARLETGIRATAIGSTQHAVQVSGNTITISDEGLLPLRNIPMVPFVVHANEGMEEIEGEFEKKLRLYDVEKAEGPFAFGFHLHGPPSFGFLNGIVEAALGAWNAVGGTEPIIFAFETDVAMNVGQIATKQTEHSVFAIDGVELDQFGYIDIGEPLESTDAVPLTVKSLLFEG